MALPWRRRPPASLWDWEPTPYCDRLTLAEPFVVDTDSRAKAEDLTTYRTLADSFVETLVDAVQPTPPKPAWSRSPWRGARRRG